MKLQAIRAMKGITEGPHDRHVSRHEHASRRQRGQSGRFLSKKDQLPPEAEQEEENFDDFLKEDSIIIMNIEGGQNDKSVHSSNLPHGHVF